MLGKKRVFDYEYECSIKLKHNHDRCFRELFFMCNTNHESFEMEKHAL